MKLRLETHGGATAFQPGELIEGVAAWEAGHAPTRVEVRLFWFTSGKGDQDVGVVAVQTFEAPRQVDARPFALAVPEGPWSFSGRLITLSWALELVALPGALAARVELVVSPTGRELQLSTAQDRFPLRT